MEYRRHLGGSERGRAVIGALALGLLVACPGTDDTGRDTDSAAPVLPVELGECEDGTALAWAEVETVFSLRCTGCHSSELAGDARSGAPELIDYDSAEAAFANAFLTWSILYSGQMPKGTGPLPDDEAWLLWEWLSCGGPE